LRHKFFLITRIHDYACVYFAAAASSRSQARCVGSIVISGGINAAVTSGGY
jgi:hypothetical protein